MSLATGTLNLLQKRLPKVIDAKTHGVIDYSHASFFLVLALLCRKSNPRGAAAALATGAFVLTQSLLTDYPLGAKRILPFAAHGQMDAGFGVGSFLIPTLFGFEGTKAATVFRCNAVVESTIVGLTDFDSERARGQEAL